MFTQTPKPDPHFSAYYEDNSILIQFMIVEFVHIYQLILQIKTLIDQHLDQHYASGDLLSSLIHLLNQLVGCLPQQERSSLSRWTKGSLTKFKEYCEQFSRNSFYQNKQHINLHMAAHQTWLTAIHNLELLNSLAIHLSAQNTDFVLIFPFKRPFDHLQARFNQVIRHIPRVMNDYCNNENVILCLLRKKAQFTTIYGSDFLSKRFKWSVKTKDLVQLLMQRYQARGFEALLSTIQQINHEEIIYDVP